MTKEITPKSSKSDILEAYNEALQKVQEQNFQSPKLIKENEEKQKIVKTASGFNYENIIKEISDLKITLNQALEGIEKSLSSEWKKLTTVQEAIRTEEQRLQEFYQIVAGADSLSALINAQKEKKQKFEEEFQAQKAELEKEIAETKLAWHKETEDFKKSQKELAELVKQQRTREEDEFQYNMKQTRKKEQDAYLEKKTAQEKALAEQKVSFEKEYAERESKIKEREDEFAELSKKVVTFPAELEKAVKHAEKNITDQLTVKNNYEKELLAKVIDGERKLKDQTIATLQEKIKDQAALIQQLTSKADNATLQVKDIAMKAVETSVIIKNIEKTKEN